MNRRRKPVGCIRYPLRFPKPTVCPPRPPPKCTLYKPGELDPPTRVNVNVRVPLTSPQPVRCYSFTNFLQRQIDKTGHTENLLTKQFLNEWFKRCNAVRGLCPLPASQPTWNAFDILSGKLFDDYMNLYNDVCGWKPTEEIYKCNMKDCCPLSYYKETGVDIRDRFENKLVISEESKRAYYDIDAMAAEREMPIDHLIYGKPKIEQPMASGMDNSRKLHGHNQCVCVVVNDEFPVESRLHDGGYKQWPYEMRKKRRRSELAKAIKAMEMGPYEDLNPCDHDCCLDEIDLSASCQKKRKRRSWDWKGKKKQKPVYPPAFLEDTGIKPKWHKISPQWCLSPTDDLPGMMSGDSIVS